MPGGIVYEGVVPQDGEGGNLFQDMKFWVGHNVPNRDNLVQKIRNNGGRLFKLDRLADYLIADHAKRDAPAGSYSYKFIDDALRSGSIDDMDKYLITSSAAQSGRSPAVPQPQRTGTAQPSSSSSAARGRASRTAFTAEDDRLLAVYVTKVERNGRATSGNKIYEEFAAKHPRHTAQSWRDRWRKRLVNHPRPDVSDTEPSPPPDQLPPLPRQRISSTQRISAATSLQAEPRSSTQSPVAVQKRARFTEDEDELLRQHVEECIKINEYISGNKIYQGLADDFPQHSMHSWRDRWLRHLAPRYERDVARWKADAETLGRGRRPAKTPRQRNEVVGRPEQPPAEHNQPALSSATGTRESVEPLPMMGQSPSLAGQSTNGSHAQPVHDPISLADNDGRVGQEQTQRQNQYPQVKVESDSASPTVRNEAVSTSPNTRIKERHSSSPAAPGAYPPQPQGQSVAPLDREQVSSPADSLDLSLVDMIPTSNAAEFYRNYNQFLQVRGMNTPLPTSLQGKSIDLWKLWKAVASQKVEPAERDWQLVAETLDFNWVELETVPDDLRLFYERHLSSFEEELVGWEENSDDDVKEESEAEGNHRTIVSSSPSEDALPPSSPAALFSPKRPFAAVDNSSFRAWPQYTPKRRIDRNSVIASTPDEINGTCHLRRDETMSVTPTAKRRKTQKHGVDVEEDDLSNEMQELPSVTRARRVAEPETQDFRFDPETQPFVYEHHDDELVDEMDDDSQPNITPSQQLVFESDKVSSSLAQNSRLTNRKVREHTQTTPTPRRNARNLSRGPNLDNNGRGLGSSPSQRAQPSTSRPSQMSSRRDLSSSTQRANTPSSSTPLAKGADEIIDGFIALGYREEIVRRALKATTWTTGIAGHVMQMLQSGEGLSEKISGVWTQRDDDALALIDSAQPPKDDKEQRKRRKAQARLLAKHGEQRIKDRRIYLEMLEH